MRNLTEDVNERISQKRLRYNGHIKKIKTERIPYKTHNRMAKGERQRGRPVKRWLDGMTNDVKN